MHLLSESQSLVAAGKPQLSVEMVGRLMSMRQDDPFLMSLPVGDVHISRALERMLVSYPNRDYIADMIAPVVAVDKRFDSIFQIPVETMQNVADAMIAGSRARPNEIKYSINHTLNYSVKDYGLIDFISADEITNADPPLRPYEYSQRILVNILMLAREIRVATMAQLSTNYGANTSALSGAARWDVSTGDPVSNIFTAMEAPLVTPNVLFMGPLAWIAFRQNPNVIKYILSRPSTSMGAVPFFMDTQTVASAFGLDAVVVGRAKYNSAAEGATPVSAYIWGKSAGLIRYEAAPSPRESSMSFVTFRFGQQGLSVQVIPELLHGVRGGDYVKCVESSDEKVIGGVNSSWLYTTVVS